MKKYYVFVKETVLNDGQTYLEVITCSMDLENMKFRRILDIEKFITLGTGLSDTEEDYKGEEVKTIDYRVRSIQVKLLKH